MWRVVYSDHDCPVLDISCIGSATNPKCTRFGPGVRDHWIAHFVLSGKGYFNGSPVTAGQGFLITPGLPEHYFPDRNMPWEYVWIISNDPRIAPLFDQLQANAETGVFTYDRMDVLQRLAAFSVAHKGERLSGFDLLEQACPVFAHHADSAAPRTASSGEVYLDCAVRYIDLNLQTPITVRELTDFLGISQPYLYKLFQAQFGQSPKQYILQRKLEQAQALLRQTDLSVTHIANSVGFGDVLSFSKYFKAKTELSPQRYRSELAQS